MDYATAGNWVNRWRDKRIGVVGDLMLDRYVWGGASRISQEAPIPVVEVKSTTARPGGAANVLNNIVTLGGEAVAFGVVGHDEAGDTLRGLLGELAVDTAGVLRDPARVTTEKTRIIANHQQIVRVDTERKEPLSAETEAALLDAVRRALAAGGLDALILEDYAKGVLSPTLAQAIAARATDAGVPVALDPHPANALGVTGLTLMTPNRAEAFALAGVYHSEPVTPLEKDAALLEVARKLQARWAVESLLVTLGADGMALFRPDTAPLHVPTQAKEVFDVSGAGDTVIASCVLALAAGAAPEDAASLSNHAAGVVVGKVGTAPVSSEELVAYFKAERTD